MSSLSRLMTLLTLLFWIGVVHGQGVCTPSATVACVLGDRFQVEVMWEDASGNACALPGQATSGVGSVLTQDSDTAVFALTDANTADLYVTILDGCSVNGHVWVMAAAATDVGFTILVTDTQTGVSRSYVNPVGVPASSIADTTAFDSCPAKRSSGVPPIKSSAPMRIKQESCVPSATAMCLQSGRFEVNLTWRDASSNTGNGQVVPWQTESSGLFWFFSPTNWEVLVKIVDGRPVNGNFWVMFAGTTNIEFTLTVTDHETGTVSQYVNPLFNPADAVIDRGGPCALLAGNAIPMLGPTGVILLSFAMVVAGSYALRGR